MLLAISGALGRRHRSLFSLGFEWPMMAQQKHNVVVRALVVAVAACCGVLLNRGGAWIVHHDSINYRVHDAGFGLLSDAAETAFALGPVLWTVGVVLALPLLLGCVRQVISFRRLVALQVFAYLTLVCGLGSFAALPFLGLLGATVLLWIVAIIVAAVSPAETAQLGAPPNGGPAMPPGNSEISEGPPVMSSVGRNDTGSDH